MRADELFQHHRTSPVAAVAPEVDLELAEAVVALGIKTGKAGFKGKKKEGFSKGSGGAGGGGAGGGGTGGSGSGGGRSYFICDRHWKYAAKAFRCDAPGKCQWSEN